MASLQLISILFKDRQTWSLHYDLLSHKPCTYLQAVIFIKVRADFAADKAAAGLEVIVPMPSQVQRVSCEYEQDVQPIGNQTWDWQEKQHRLVWKHKKVKGSTEWTLRVCAASCLRWLLSQFLVSSCFDMSAHIDVYWITALSP